jgi:hypothetical protein
MIKVRLSNPSERGELMSPKEYAEYTKEEPH